MNLECHLVHLVDPCVAPKKSIFQINLVCGIFAYLNYLIEKDRKYIIDTLIKGLERLEYRGYDSAGLVINGDDEDTFKIYKQV